MDDPDIKPKVITRIYDAVSNLIVPPLAPLFGIFRERKAALDKKRSGLMQRREDVQMEGYGAATRLMMAGERSSEVQGSYLKRINHQRGRSQ